MESLTPWVEIRSIDDDLARECGLKFVAMMYYHRYAHIAEYHVVDVKKFLMGLLKYPQEIKVYHCSPDLHIDLVANNNQPVDAAYNNSNKLNKHA